LGLPTRTGGIKPSKTPPIPTSGAAPPAPAPVAAGHNSPAQQAQNQARQKAAREAQERAAAARTGGVKPIPTGTGGAGEPTSSSISAPVDPRVTGVMGDVDKFIGRIPERAGHLMEVAAGKSRDASAGINRGLDASLARRGAAGSGVDATLRSQEGGRTQREIAAQNTAIADNLSNQELSALGVKGGLATSAGNLQQGLLGIELSKLASDRADQSASFQQILAALGELRQPSFHPEQTWGAPQVQQSSTTVPFQGTQTGSASTSRGAFGVGGSTSTSRIRTGGHL